jgi:hypothetical protein
MIDTYPNPWNFNNEDKKLTSEDNFFKVVYDELNEIGMGAPIGGKCYLENFDKKKVKINDWCGGPPAWETEGKLVAIPIWKKKFFKGTVQQISVLDISKMELKIFSKTFRVIDIRSFHENKIYGYDSPLHKTKTISFDINKESVDKVIKLI